MYISRLQELQYTVTGGTKVIAGKNLSPRSTRGYLKTSIRCKQESLRMKNSAVRKSPVGKFQGSAGGDWRRMSLPAMLVGETVGEILQASQFAREIVAAVEAKPRKIAKTNCIYSVSIFTPILDIYTLPYSSFCMLISSKNNNLIDQILLDQST